MRLLVGTYRKQKHIGDCLRSVEQHLRGVTDIIFIDDSGDPEHSAWLTRHGKVIEVGARGYTTAMQHACQAAEDQEAFWLEEDFTFLETINLNYLSEILWHRPYLAEISLLRGPHFPIEHQTGGLLEALKAKGHTINDVHGVLEQTATFTMNPSLIRGAVWAAGWPHGRLTEERKRDELLQNGYRFGFLPGTKVAHFGQREGHGY